MSDNGKNIKVNYWLELTARIGFAAKGILYIVIGVLAFQVVIGLGGETAGMKDVLKTIHKQAGVFGDAVLFIIALGLTAHSFWRLMQSLFNADNKEIDFKNIIDRIGYFTSVIVYGGLAFLSFKIVIGLGGGGSSPQAMTASVLNKPLGRWLIILTGLAIGGSGLFQIYFGISRKFEFKYDLQNMNDFEIKLARYVSLIGLAARGIVFVLLSVFLIQAGLEFNPDKAGGMDKALEKALNQPYGHWLLGIAAVGLAAYGGYCILLGKFRKIPINKK